MTDPFTPDTFADTSAGGTPITAAKLNKIENAIDQLWNVAAFQGAFTTAGRPAASSVSVGFWYFDTTLHRPAWSDGTAWRDATGTTV